ncbi:serine hydrolase domain-containing protein [Solibacillus sp. FSL H8-0523]|uniref:serine hydrolase domain-containing protein n=2 Tax=unclassified Solibacillus TaxID=2637870 RepID=UPI00310132AC
MMMPFSRVAQFIDTVIQNKELPGAVLAVANAKDLLYCKAFGMAHTAQHIPMTEQTIFDCASLTKIVATTSSVLLLLERGQLDLDDAISDYFPSLKQQHEEVKIHHLLTHTSGFQEGIKFYKKQIAYTEVVEYIAQLTHRNAINKKVIYSDINYILLGILIEKVANASLADYAEKNIFQPLGMQHTQFNPPAELQGKIAATEYRDYLKQHQWGEVHDENAHHFGGVSGHAGLFSTAEDLVKFAQAFMKNGHSIFQEQTKHLAKQSFTKQHEDQRGLGWQLYSQPSFSGQYLRDGFGHTGFTGTSLWISEEKQLAIILLTNRVHLGRSCEIQRFRRIVHNLIALENE